MLVKDITEGCNYPVIVVDVQAECHGMNNVCQHMVDFVQKHAGPVLMFVNAEDQCITGDTIKSVRTYWEETSVAECGEFAGAETEDSAEKVKDLAADAVDIG